MPFHGNLHGCCSAKVAIARPVASSDRDLFSAAHDAAGARRGNALGRRGGSHDSLRRLGRAAPTGNCLCRSAAVGKLVDGRGRLGARHDGRGCHSAAQRDGNAAHHAHHLFLRSNFSHANRRFGGRGCLRVALASAATRPAGRERVAVHAPGRRRDAELARHVPARRLSGGGVGNRL